MAGRRRPKHEDETKRVLEATAGGIGAVLALLTLGVIAWDGISADSRPPAVVVEAARVDEIPNGFVVEVNAINRGDYTAAQVVVEGTLSRDGAVMETSETTFDYVPSDAQRSGGLYFTNDPRTYELALRAKGYTNP